MKTPITGGGVNSKAYARLGHSDKTRRRGFGLWLGVISKRLEDGNARTAKKLVGECRAGEAKRRGARGIEVGATYTKWLVYPVQ